MNDPVQRRTVLLASGGALLLAAALLLAVILPAEYGWDPLGTGIKFGLLGMTGEESTAIIVIAMTLKVDQNQDKSACSALAAMASKSSSRPRGIIN